MDFVPKTNWSDEPSVMTPITASQLIRIEEGIVEGARDASETLPGNVELATATEMTTGTDALRVPSVVRVKDYVAAQIATIPGLSPASESVSGSVELATTAEMTTGTDALRVPSVVRVKDYVAAQIATALASIPGVAPASESASGIVELATTAEMTTGEDQLRVPSVVRVKDYVATQIAAALATIPGLSPASESASGIVELATTTEMTTGTDALRVPSVVRVKDYVAAQIANIPNNADVEAHDADAASHPLTSQAISELQSSLLGKADLVGGAIDIDQIPKSQLALPDTIAQRDATGALSVAYANDASHAVTLGQANFLYGSDASEAIVRDLFATGLPVSAPTDSTFVKIPTVRITDGKTGDKWRCEYSIKYRASATAGISIQHSGNVAGVTNLLSNPSFETEISPWFKSFGSFANPVRTATGGGQDGSFNMTMTCTAAAPTIANGQYASEWIETTAGTIHSAGAYVKLGAGTGKYARVDIIYLLDTQLQVTGNNGDNPGGGRKIADGSWVRLVNQGIATAPSNVTHVRVRLTYEDAILGDSVRFDAVQLEAAAVLPAYGSTGGSGDALTFDGWWSGLTLAAPTVDDYRRIQTYRTGATLAPCTFGGLGPSTDAQLIGSFVVNIGGTALLNQSIEFEFRQRVADGVNATQIVSANATLVELP